VFLDDVGEAGAFLVLLGGGVRPAFDGLGDVLDVHPQVEPVQHVVGGTDARRLARAPWSLGAVAENGHRPRPGGPEVMQHAAQLLGLMVGFRRHAREDDALAVVIAGLRNDDLKGADLVGAD